MVSRKKSVVFVIPDNPGVLDRIPSGEADAVDNPDGVVRAYGLGAYESDGDNGRDFSQGAGTPKGNVGNASGKSRNMKVTSGSR